MVLGLRRLNPVKTASALCFAGGTLYICGGILTSARDSFGPQILNRTPFSRKSVPSRPTVSVGIKQTKNVCVLSCMFSQKVNICSPFTPSVSHAVACCFVRVILTPKLDNAGCSMKTLQLVSINTLLDIPYI